MMIRSLNPTDGTVIKEFPESSAKEVDSAIANIRSAQSEWVAMSTSTQDKAHQSLKSLLENQFEVIVDLIHQETGKTRPDAEGEVYDVIDAIDYYRAARDELLNPVQFSLNPEALPNTNAYYTTVPHGVLGLIMPWNFPFYSPAIFAIAGTISGNGVLIKPSELSTMCGLSVAQFFENAGYPKGLVSVVPGGDETGKLVAQSGVDKLFFVGSIEAGRDVIRKANGTPVQVELGGNSAAIVLEDADVELAANGIAWGALYHVGQDCAGIKRVFVDERIVDSFLEKVSGIVAGLRRGVDYGPYISEIARDEVKRRIDSAVMEGAEVIIGGEVTSPGFWLSPCVLKLTTMESQIVATETFGNVLPVFVVSGEDEAIHLANNTEYGLSNAIFSKNEQRAKRIADRLEAGMAFINDPVVPFPAWDHWTGWKSSGFGTVESKYQQCLKKQVFCINRGQQVRDFWFPY